MMLNVGQLKRILLVMALPLIVAGVWLAEGGYKNFIASNLESICFQDGECKYFYTREYDRWPTKGLHLNHMYSGARLSGTLNEEVVLAGSSVHRSLLIFPTVDGGINGCSLEFFKTYQKFDGDNSQSILRDVFFLNCGSRSLPPFQFKNPSVQENLMLAFANNAQITSRFYKVQTAISFISFFVPSILFLGLLGLVAAFRPAFRWIKHGKRN